MHVFNNFKLDQWSAIRSISGDEKMECRCSVQKSIDDPNIDGEVAEVSFLRIDSISGNERIEVISCTKIEAKMLREHIVETNSGTEI